MKCRKAESVSQSGNEVPLYQFYEDGDSSGTRSEITQKKEIKDLKISLRREK